MLRTDHLLIMGFFYYALSAQRERNPARCFTAVSWFRTEGFRYIYKLPCSSIYFIHLAKYYDRTSCSFQFSAAAYWRCASHWVGSLAFWEVHRVTVAATVGGALDHRIRSHVPSTTMHPFDSLVDHKPCTRRLLKEYPIDNSRSNFELEIKVRFFIPIKLVFS